MPQGIQIWGSHGFQQIGTRAPLFCLHSSGSVNLIANYGGQSNPRYAEVLRPASGRSVLVLRPPTGAPALVYGIRIDGANVYWQIVSTGPAGTAIPYWVFSEPQHAASFGTVTFETYSSTGALIYQNNKRPMRLKSVHDALTGTVTGTAGRTYAAFEMKSGSNMIWEPGAINPSTGLPDFNYYGRNWYLPAYRAATNGIEVSTWRHSWDIEGTLTPGSDDSRVNSFGLVDVTGY